jgi:hypothetical protein
LDFDNNQEAVDVDNTIQKVTEDNVATGKVF